MSMTPRNDDDFPPFVRGSDTSHGAAESVEKDTPRLRRLVLAHIGSLAHGATCDEVEVALVLRHQTASARITELRDGGQIVDSGARRATRSGRNAVVWTLPPPARAL